MSVNKVMLIGRLVKDPETKTVGDNTVTNFTIVTNEKYKNKSGELIEESEFHNCVLWGPRGQALSKYKKKGEELFVEGSIKTRTWEHEGQKKYRTEVKVFNFIFIGSSKQNTNGNVPIDDDLPF